LIGGTGAGLRVAGADDGAASSGNAPSVAAPHTPKIKMTVSVLSLPNATSFRRHEDTADIPEGGYLMIPTAGDLDSVLSPEPCRRRGMAASPEC
jgi:hypothetical protein